MRLCLFSAHRSTHEVQVYPRMSRRCPYATDSLLYRVGSSSQQTRERGRWRILRANPKSKLRSHLRAFKVLLPPFQKTQLYPELHLTTLCILNQANVFIHKKSETTHNSLCRVHDCCKSCLFGIYCPSPHQALQQ